MFSVLSSLSQPGIFGLEDLGIRFRKQDVDHIYLKAFQLVHLFCFYYVYPYVAIVLKSIPF